MSELTLKRNSFSSLLLVLKGMIVGTGAILPGISGGVLCVAFGIYEPLMQVLSDPRKYLKQHLSLFLPFAFGWLLGFLLLAGAVEAFFEVSPLSALTLFAGLIIGTVPGLLEEAEEKKSSWSWLLLSFLFFSLFFSLLKESAVAAISANAFWYVFCGVVWGFSLIIPGLSSSSLLILLGLYQPMTAGIAALDFTVILPLLLGLSLTVILFSKIVVSLFTKQRSILLKVIAGIMLASAVCMLPQITYEPLSLLLSVLCFLIGYLLARKMDKAKAVSE